MLFLAQELDQVIYLIRLQDTAWMRFVNMVRDESFGVEEATTRPTSFLQYVAEARKNAYEFGPGEVLGFGEKAA